MSTTTKYCITNGSSLVYAPTYLVVDGVLTINPTTEQYARAGWLVNAVLPPSPPAGKVVGSFRYEARDGRISAVYEYVDEPPRVRVFSKLKLYVVLSSLGLWEPLSAWMGTKVVNGMSAEVAFYLANELSDAHPMFAALFAEAKTALGVDDETAERILSEAEA